MSRASPHHLDAQLDGAAALKPRMHRGVGTANGMGHERRVFEGWRLGHRCRHRLGLWGMGMYPCECAAGPATLFIFGSRLCGVHDGNRSCTLGHKGEKRRRAIRPARKKKDARSARARLVRLGRYYLCAAAAYRVDALRCLADTAGARAQRAVGGAKAHSEDGDGISLSRSMPNAGGATVDSRAPIGKAWMRPTLLGPTPLRPALLRPALLRASTAQANAAQANTT